ncbi:ABC transporter permease subunit [uncultured Desulfosarcina sp.]|uniref:PstA family ABC transporter permease n=1 Tax=uncultured Desulfosarcina sp. TaxID=218289 RepID=UPI0029C790E3|nr:ABC transporter permease subunit [uncultured Desulfosarcina sp.]
MIRDFTEKLIFVLSWAMTAALCAVVLVFVGYLFYNALPSLGIELIFGTVPPLEALLGRARVFDGIFAALAGTLLLVTWSTVLAIPTGVAAGIYLAEYARPAIKGLFGFFFDLLAGVPSIVIGLFGFSIAIFLHQQFPGRLGPCLLISAMSLAFLVLPYIIRSTQVALENLPPTIRNTAPALGATKLQNIAHVLLPRALAGIVSGIMLAIGRCAEDTAVIMLTGVVAIAGVPRSPLSPYEALPFYIYYISSQYTDPAELSRGYGACLILLATCAILFMLAYYIQRSLTYRSLYRL